MKKSAALIIFPLLALSLSCGGAIESSQDFKPNKQPVIESMTGSFYNPSGLAFDSSALISHMTFDIMVAASDPEGQDLAYSYTSDYGSFSD
ncbi:MAG: hypothetical protein ACRCUT_06335, partial [Spirochaetota bacterium]